jgi:hypothetical protein
VLNTKCSLRQQGAAWAPEITAVPPLTGRFPKGRAEEGASQGLHIPSDLVMGKRRNWDAWERGQDSLWKLGMGF